MGLQVIWSFGLAFMDAYALAKKKVIHNPGLISLFVVGDWVSPLIKPSEIPILFLRYVQIKGLFDQSYFKGKYKS